MDHFKITEEHKKKMEKCKTPEECIALAKEFGYDLNDEQIEEINGGQELGTSWKKQDTCPKCGGHSISQYRPNPYMVVYHCNTCGYEWN